MTPQERVLVARRHIADMELTKQEYPHLTSTLQPLITECERQIQDLIDAHAPKRRSPALRAGWVWIGLAMVLACYAGIGVLIALGV